MASEDDTFKYNIEEYKEIGHEYRYRDQLMVQEFSLSMVAVGVLLNVIFKVPALSPIWSIVLQIFGGAFLFLLALHLRNINQDRLAALKRRDQLREALKFGEFHGNVSGKRRFSAPREMVRFAKIVAAVWVVWTLVSVVLLVRA